MGALPRKRGPALGRDGHVQAASPRPMLGSERLHRGTRAPRDGATTEPHGAPSSRGQGLGVPGCGGTCHPCPRLAPHVGSPAQRAHGGAEPWGSHGAHGPGQTPTGAGGPGRANAHLWGAAGPGNSHRAPLLPAPRRTRKPGAGQQGRAFRSPPRLCLPRTAPAPARQTQRALRGGTCHLHPGATRRGRLGRGLGALFCAVSTAFKTKSVGTGLSVSGLSNEQGTFGENENLIFQLKP